MAGDAGEVAVVRGTPAVDPAPGGADDVEVGDGAAADVGVAPDVGAAPEVGDAPEPGDPPEVGDAPEPGGPPEVGDGLTVLAASGTGREA